MKPHLVSVIIPTLNEEKYIESALKSLINQDYEGKYEIIVADGMSKDNTVKIARKYADKVVLIKERGVAKARNVGVKAAKGDILLFVDADVIVLPNALFELLKTFKKNKIVGVGCAKLPLSEKLRDFIVYWFIFRLEKIALKFNLAYVGGLFCAYRKNIFERVGGFDEKLIACEDYDLSKKISKYGKIIQLDKPLVLVSTRRVKKWGFLKTTWKYLKIYLNYVIFRKSIKPKDYKPVR